jgi:hypothetical protein
MPLVGVAACPWLHTEAGKLGISTLLRQGDKVQRCRSLTLPNGDKVEITKYVIYRREGRSRVGRVEEILVEPETDSVLGILLSACEIGPDILPYRLPSCTVQLDQRLMIAFTVGVCISHNPSQLILCLGAYLRSQREPQLCSSSMQDDTYTPSSSRAPAY